MMIKKLGTGYYSRTIWALAAVCLVVAFAMPAAAQQNLQTAPSYHSAPPPLVLPGNQGNRGGTGTLELPTSPAAQTQPNFPPPPPTQQELVIPSRQLREAPGYAQVTVTVTDPSGGYVTGLNKQDFKLFMDGQPRPIEFFRQDLNTPVSVGILVDTSGSMFPKLPQAEMAISEFLRDLNDKDDVFLVAFSGRPFMLQGFTTDHSLVRSRLALLHPQGSTSIYDALVIGLAQLQRGRYDKKALLVVTDGMDNTSQHSLQDVVNQARRQGVLIYSIGIGNPNGGGSAGSFAIGPLSFRVGGDDDDEVDTQTLKMLSVETGAKTYNIRAIGDGATMRAACTQISSELREQYTVGFVAPDPSAGGYRSVRVDVPTHPGVDVRVRKGVDVGSRAYAGGGAPGSPY